MRNTISSNRAHRATGEDYPLKVSAKYVELLCSLPDFREFTTNQLLHMLPKKYRAHVPSVGKFFEVRDHAHAQEDRMARAVIIGMLAFSEQIEGYVSMKFIERSFVVEG